MYQSALIIGAGQAGLQTAISLRQGGFQGRVILLGGEPHLPYQRPPLSKQVLKGEFDQEKCTLRQQKFLDDQNIEFRGDTTARSLDVAGRQVEVDDGRVIDYDALVIATGARLNRMELSGSGLSGVHYLRTLDDALSLRERLNDGARLVVAGGGYIGLEVAASARALGGTVHVVEAQEHIMQRSALPPIADFLLDRHKTEGVTFHFGRLMTEIHGVGAVQAVSLDDGTFIETDVVLKGIGVRPDIEWLQDSELETNVGVVVDACCRTSNEHIFAAGDCAETKHPWYPQPVVLESVQNAVSQGKLCASAILGEPRPYEETPWFWSEQYGSRLQMAGLPQPGDELVVRDSAPNSLSVLSLGSDRLNAIQCIDAPRDYLAARKIIAAGDNIKVEMLRTPDLELKELL